MCGTHALRGWHAACGINGGVDVGQVAWSAVGAVHLHQRAALAVDHQHAGVTDFTHAVDAGAYCALHVDRGIGAANVDEVACCEFGGSGVVVAAAHSEVAQQVTVLSDAQVVGCHSAVPLQQRRSL
jgi:hypothetical protein